MSQLVSPVLGLLLSIGLKSTVLLPGRGRPVGDLTHGENYWVVDC
jgi:hypothetical protein